MAIATGSVVWLRSGSPPMTANKVENNEVTTQWFMNGSYQSAIFPLNSLIELDPRATLDVAYEKALEAERAKSAVAAEAVPKP